MINVTERASQEVKHIIAESGETGDVYLRLRIVGGGCSGFQTKLDLDPNTDILLDEFFESNGVKIVVDKRSLLYATGATVDFHDALDVRGFKVEVPGAKATCGCGSSMSF